MKQSLLRRFACFIDSHEWDKDDRPVNGVWWAFCKHCGARAGGEYDPATGKTTWRYR